MQERAPLLIERALILGEGGPTLPGGDRTANLSDRKP